MVTYVLLALGLYLVLGILYAVPFVLRGVGRIDPDAEHGSWGFRTAILPGVVALWPLVLIRSRSGSPPPTGRSPHRLRAKEAHA